MIHWKNKEVLFVNENSLILFSGASTLQIAQQMIQKCLSWVAGQHSLCVPVGSLNLALVWFYTWKCRILAQGHWTQFIDEAAVVCLTLNILILLWFPPNPEPEFSLMGSAALAIHCSLSQGAEWGCVLWSFCLQWLRFTMNNSLDRFLPL